jgi:hypothetical protein
MRSEGEYPGPDDERAFDGDGASASGDTEWEGGSDVQRVLRECAATGSDEVAFAGEGVFGRSSIDGEAEGKGFGFGREVIFREEGRIGQLEMEAPGGDPAGVGELEASAQDITFLGTGAIKGEAGSDAAEREPGPEESQEAECDEARDEAPSP